MHVRTCSSVVYEYVHKDVYNKMYIMRQFARHSFPEIFLADNYCSDV